MTTKTIALIGSPNTGKTTLFNWLTGSNFKTVNYPGATVEYAVSQLAAHWQASVEVIDTPGIYSFSAQSEDEEVTLKVLQDPKLKVSEILVVVDATQLERTLLLVDQALLTGKPVIVALTMSDLLKHENVKINKQILENHYQVPFVEVDGVLGGGLKELVQQIAVAKSTSQKIPAANTSIKELNLKNKKLAADTLSSKEAQGLAITRLTAKIDRVALNPFLGPILFLSLMVLLFTSIFWLAAPLMDFVDGQFSNLADWSKEAIQNSLMADFIGDGVIAGMGAVMVFVPQIFILFFGLSFLEQSGYLARAATLIDTPLRKIGLGGRSFVPLLSGFACAVPATMAARNIPSKKDRLITIFIIPMMTCSARLPVYALLLTFLFQNKPAWQAGLGLAFMYLGALLAGGFASAILNMLIPEDKKGHFLMELPLYRRPLLKQMFIHAYAKTGNYIKRAGLPIFIFATLIWAGTTFPNYQAENDAVKLETSYIGRMGAAIEPVFKPIGADWRVGIGLISAFAAREVFVSSMAVIFNISTEDDETMQQGLIATMAQATNSTGQLIFTPASVVALLLFFMIALQCTTTSAVVGKEMGSWKFASIQVIALNAFAYIVAATAYQILNLF